LAEFIKVPENNVAPIPPDMSFPEAAIVSASLATSFRAVQEAKIEQDHFVTIYGCGSLGLGSLALIAPGNSRVIAIDMDNKRLKLAKELGAWETINVAEEKPSAAVLKLTKMEGADRVLLMVGDPQAFQEAILSVKPGGKAVLAGYTAESFMFRPIQFISTEISLAGIHHAPCHLLPELILLVSQKQICLDRLISHVLNPLSAVNRGIEILHKENPLKVIVQP
jgi:threonine dehydrogenase-like Zn-dependent dehydrogenase